MMTTVLCYSATLGAHITDYGTPFRVDMGNVGLASYGVLPMDASAFREWARLMHRRSYTMTEDAMIAATATVHRMTVVTRNVSDFVQLGVELQNPFDRE